MILSVVVVVLLLIGVAAAVSLGIVLSKGEICEVCYASMRPLLKRCLTIFTQYYDFSLITRKHSIGMRATRLPKVPVLVAEGRYLERGILPLWDTYPLDTSTHRIPAPSWKPTSRIRTPLDTYPLGYLPPMSTPTDAYPLMPTSWTLTQHPQDVYPEKRPGTSKSYRWFEGKLI